MTLLGSIYMSLKNESMSIGGITGFDWFLAVAGGASKVSDMNGENVQVSTVPVHIDGVDRDAPNPYKITFSAKEVGMLPLFLFSGGLSWNIGKVHTRFELGLNALALFAGDPKDIGQVKVMAGYEVAKNFIISGMLGAQVWTLNKMHVKASSALLGINDGAFYISDQNQAQGQSYAPYFWNTFLGAELKYRIQDGVYVTGSAQMGLHSTTKTGNMYMITEQDVKAQKTNVTYPSGRIFPDTIIGSVSSKTVWKASISFLIESGGIL